MTQHRHHAMRNASLRSERRFQRCMNAFAVTVSLLTLAVCIALCVVGWWLHAAVMAGIGLGSTIVIVLLARTGYARDLTGQPLTGDDADKAAQSRYRSYIRANPGIE